jgi:hypothetical protein
MRLPAAFVAVAATLAAAPAVAQQPPAPPPAAPAVAQQPPAAPAPPPAAAPPFAPAPWGAPQAYGMPYAGQPYAPYGSPWAPPPYQPPVTERRSTGMMVAAIVLWGAGAVATVIGTAMYVPKAGEICEFDTVGAQPAPAHRAARRERIGTSRQALTNGCGDDLTLGFSLMTGGILAGIAAIPLFVVGDSRVRALPQLRVGATDTALRWTF